MKMIALPFMIGEVRPKGRPELRPLGSVPAQIIWNLEKWDRTSSSAVTLPLSKPSDPEEDGNIRILLSIALELPQREAATRFDLPRKVACSSSAFFRFAEELEALSKQRVGLVRLVDVDFGIQGMLLFEKKAKLPGTAFSFKLSTGPSFFPGAYASPEGVIKDFLASSVMPFGFAGQAIAFAEETMQLFCRECRQFLTGPF
jgi:hypothetical protein